MGEQCAQVWDSFHGGFLDSQNSLTFALKAKKLEFHIYEIAVRGG